MGDLADGREYGNFRAWVPRRQIPVGKKSSQDWVYYDWGRRAYAEPLVCVHDMIGDGDAFYQQVIYLSLRGYRVISVCLPNAESFKELGESFDLFLRAIGTKRVHLYGAGLGGLLCLVVAAKHPERVRSLALTHAALTLDNYKKQVQMLRPLIRVAPSFVLENSLLSLCPSGMVEIAEALAAEFVIERTLERGRDGIVNRLLLCTSPEKLNTWIRIPDEYVSVIDVLRPSSQNASNNRMQLRRRLQGARFADLKDGGEFPYLSTPDAVSIHLLVHMRRHAKPPLAVINPPPEAKPPAENPIDRRRKRELMKKHLKEQEAAKGIPKKRLDRLSSNEKRDLEHQYQQSINRLQQILPAAPQAQLAQALGATGGNVDAVIKFLEESGGDIQSLLSSPESRGSNQLDGGYPAEAPFHADDSTVEEADRDNAVTDASEEEKRVVKGSEAVTTDIQADGQVEKKIEEKNRAEDVYVSPTPEVITEEDDHRVQRKSVESTPQSTETLGETHKGTNDDIPSQPLSMLSNLDEEDLDAASMKLLLKRFNEQGEALEMKYGSQQEGPDVLGIHQAGLSKNVSQGDDDMGQQGATDVIDSPKGDRREDVNDSGNGDRWWKDDIKGPTAAKRETSIEEVEDGPPRAAFQSDGSLSKQGMEHRCDGPSTSELDVPVPSNSKESVLAKNVAQSSKSSEEVRTESSDRMVATGSSGQEVSLAVQQYSPDLKAHKGAQSYTNPLNLGHSETSALRSNSDRNPKLSEEFKEDGTEPLEDSGGNTRERTIEADPGDSSDPSVHQVEEEVRPKSFDMETEGDAADEPLVGKQSTVHTQEEITGANKTVLQGTGVNINADEESGRNMAESIRHELVSAVEPMTTPVAWMDQTNAPESSEIRSVAETWHKDDSRDSVRFTAAVQNAHKPEDEALSNSDETQVCREGEVEQDGVIQNSPASTDPIDKNCDNSVHTGSLDVEQPARGAVNSTKKDGTVAACPTMSVMTGIVQDENNSGVVEDCLAEAEAQRNAEEARRETLREAVERRWEADRTRRDSLRQARETRRELRRQAQEQMGHIEETRIDADGQRKDERQKIEHVRREEDGSRISAEMQSGTSGQDGPLTESSGGSRSPESSLKVEGERTQRREETSRSTSMADDRSRQEEEDAKSRPIRRTEEGESQQTQREDEVSRRQLEEAKSTCESSRQQLEEPEGQTQIVHEESRRQFEEAQDQTRMATEETGQQLEDVQGRTQMAHEVSRGQLEEASRQTRRTSEDSRELLEESRRQILPAEEEAREQADGTETQAVEHPEKTVKRVDKVWTGMATNPMGGEDPGTSSDTDGAFEERGSGVEQLRTTGSVEREVGGREGGIEGNASQDSSGPGQFTGADLSAPDEIRSAPTTEAPDQNDESPGIAAGERGDETKMKTTSGTEAVKAHVTGIVVGAQTGMEEESEEAVRERKEFVKRFLATIYEEETMATEAMAETVSSVTGEAAHGGDDSDAIEDGRDVSHVQIVPPTRGESDIANEAGDNTSSVTTLGREQASDIVEEDDAVVPATGQDGDESDLDGVDAEETNNSHAVETF